MDYFVHLEVKDKNLKPKELNLMQHIKILITRI